MTLKMKYTIILSQDIDGRFFIFNRDGDGRFIILYIILNRDQAGRFHYF